MAQSINKSAYTDISTQENQPNETLTQTDNPLSSTTTDLYTNHTDDYTLHLMEIQEINNYINCVFIFLCAPFILAGNLLTILSVRKFRPLQTVMNMYIVSLAFADLIVGFPTIPTYIVFFLLKDVHSIKYICLLKYVFVLIGLPASILNLLVVTIDRFVAVRCPLQYVSMMTKRRAKILISLVWFYSIGSACLPLLGLNTWKEGMPCDFWRILPRPFTMVTVSGIMITCLPCMLLMYVIIFHEIKKNRKRMAKYRSKAKEAVINLQRDSRRAKLMAFVFLTFLFFWFPFGLASVLKQTDLHPIIIEMVKVCTVSITMSNSMVNPIIYCWIRPDFRSAFKTLAGIRKSDQISQSDLNSDSKDGEVRGETVKKTVSRTDIATITEPLEY